MTMRSGWLLALCLWAAGSARAALVDGLFAAFDADNVNIDCTMFGEGQTFGEVVRIMGTDASKNGASLRFDALEPSSANRSATKLSVKQSEAVNARFIANGGAITYIDDVEIAKCSIGGTASISKSHVTASLSCHGNDAAGELGEASIPNLVALFTGQKHAKFSVDAQHHRWSLSLQCSGPFEI